MSLDMMLRNSLVPLPLAFVTAVLAKHGGAVEDDSGSDSDDDNNRTPSSSTPTSTSTQPTSTQPTSTVTDTATPSTSQTTTSSIPSSTPILQFLTPANATVCRNTTFAWKYTGLSDVALTISVTNERAVGLQQDNQTVLISRTLTNAVSSTAEMMPWNHVDVPVGAYVAVAFDTQRTTGINAQSLPFFVLNGSDTSCLNTITSTSLHQTSTFPPASSTSSTSAVQTSSVAETTPMPGGLSSGALAGTVAGVIVGVLLLLLAFTFPSFWRHSLPRRQSSRASRPGGPYLLF